MGNIRPRKIPEFFAIIWRRKLTIILLTVAMLLATLPIITSLPDTYESRGIVAISFKNGADSQVVSAQITSATQQLSSQSLLEAINWKYSVYPNAETVDEVIAKMRKSIKTETKFRGYYPDGPESISIAFRHPDQKIAHQVMTDLISIFDNSNTLSTQEANNEFTSISGEIAKTGAELNQFIEAAKQKNNNAPSPKTVIDPAAVNSQRLTTVTAIASLNDKQFGIEQQIETLKKQITEQQKTVRQKVPTVTVNSAIGALKLKKADLEGLLVTYTTQYTEKNPKVIQTRAQLAEVNRQLAAEVSTTNEFDTSPLASLEARELRDHQRELSRLEIENEVTKRDIERKKQFLSGLPSVDPSTAFTKTEALPTNHQAQDFSVPSYSNLIDRQKTLLLRRDVLQHQMIGGAGVFLVVDKPTVSNVPVAPNRNLLKLIGLVMALGLGVVTALSLEVPRIVKLQDEQDIEYFLGTPILAAIPETLTETESNRSQRLRLAQGFIKLTLIGLLVPLLYLLINGIGIFQLLGNR